MATERTKGFFHLHFDAGEVLLPTERTLPRRVDGRRRRRWRIRWAWQPGLVGGAFEFLLYSVASSYSEGVASRIQIIAWS